MMWAQRKASALDRPKQLPAQPDPRARVRSQPSTEWMVSHPGFELTAAKINAAFRSAEVGNTSVQCALFDDVIENDAHLRDCFDSRIEAVAGKEWIVQAGGDAPEDQRAAELLEAALRAVPNITETLEHQLTVNIYGWAASEIHWEHVDNLWVPVWFANAPARRFRFELATEKPLLLTEEKSWEGEELIPGRWIFSRRRHNAIARAGLMRTAAWFALFKRMAVRDWLVFADRFGLPYVVGKYDADKDDPKEKEALEEAVKSIGTDGYAMMSKATEIAFEHVQHGGSGSDIHAAITKLADDQNSKLITGSTLMSQAGGPGSYALGRVQENRSFQRELGDAQRLGIRFEQDLGRPFVEFNGLRARPPRLKIHVVREYDPKTRAGVLSTLANELGVELDEDQVRQEFQVKKPTGSALKGTKKPAAPAADEAPAGDD